MTLELAREQCNLRFQEVRRTIEIVRNLESTDPLVPDGVEVVALRGLFYVHLYGAFEFSVNKVVQELISGISSKGVPIADLEHCLYSVALDAEWKSIRDSGKDPWLKRLVTLNKQLSSGTCTINEGLFGNYLQNIWFDSLQIVFDCFALPYPVVPEDPLRGYIDEVVDKRNKVAHGRESAITVGSGTRSDDLRIRLEALIRIVEHLYGCVERFLAGYEYIKVTKRTAYLAT